MSRSSHTRPVSWLATPWWTPLLRWTPLFLCGACEIDRADPPRNLVLVTLDTTRADALAGDRMSQELAPRIVALAQGGVRFERAYTVAPLTLPAHASLMTGLVPPRHGVHGNGTTALPESATTLAETLGENGFQTAAFVSALVLDRGFGLDQGFATYDQPELLPRADAREAQRPGAETVRRASQWLARRDESRPFFLWVHLYDAHSPYTPAPEDLARAGGDPYRGEIAALDDAVGLLLDALSEQDLDSSTLVVLTADHGESRGEHGEPLHGALCYEATMRIPLLFQFPDAAPRPGPVRLASLVDLYPTLLARFGLPIPDELDGQDLFDHEAASARGVYFESMTGYQAYGWSPLAGWLDWQGKYLHSSDPEFYAVLRDAGERVDLASSRVRECEAARAHIAELWRRPALEPRPVETDADLRAALSALGYERGQASAGEVPSPLEASDRPSPGSRTEELEPLLRASNLFEQGRYAECRPLLSEILRENPRHLLAMDYLALCLMHAREFEQAEEILRRRLSEDEVADARLNLGLCRLELGDLEEAREEIESAARLLPDEPSIQEALARVRARMGR